MLIAVALIMFLKVFLVHIVVLRWCALSNTILMFDVLEVLLDMMLERNMIFSNCCLLPELKLMSAIIWKFYFVVGVLTVFGQPWLLIKVFLVVHCWLFLVLLQARHLSILYLHMATLCCIGFGSLPPWGSLYSVAASIRVLRTVLSVM